MVDSTASVLIRIILRDGIIAICLPYEARLIWAWSNRCNVLCDDLRRQCRHNSISLGKLFKSDLAPNADRAHAYRLRRSVYASLWRLRS